MAKNNKIFIHVILRYQLEIPNLELNLKLLYQNVKPLIIKNMGKLNFLGIGPKIAVVLLPWLITSIVLSTHFRKMFSFTSEKSSLLFICGIVLLISGLIFYGSTVRLLLTGLKETRLVTNGAFRLCQNPLYSSIILFIIPALSLIINSWLVLSSSIAGYILFKIFIKQEYIELEKFFGDRYTKYKNETPEFFPVPLKKWFS
jgi:protein-S-isoprenylcysteine O-methyltransferase Ste14